MGSVVMRMKVQKKTPRRRDGTQRRQRVRPDWVERERDDERDALITSEMGNRSKISDKRTDGAGRASFSGRSFRIYKYRVIDR